MLSHKLVTGAVTAALLLVATAASTRAEPAKELNVRDLKLTSTGVGPIRGGSRATLADLQKLLPGFDVANGHEQGAKGATPVFEVTYLGEPVLVVVSDGKDGVAAVRALHPDVPTPVEELVVGSPFTAADRLERCTLVGEKGNGGTACTIKGLAHVTVLIATPENAWSGTGLPPAALLQTAKVTAVEWKP